MINLEKIDGSVFGWFKAILYPITVAVVASLEYVGISTKIAIPLAVLMMLDWILGILKAWRIKEPITSKKGKDGLLEKVVLLVIPVVVGLMFKVVDVPIGITLNACLAIIALNEAFSALGNIGSIYTRKPMQEFDVISILITTLRKYIMTTIKKFTDGTKTD